MPFRKAFRLVCCCLLTLVAAQSVAAQLVEAHVQNISGTVVRGSLPLRRFDVLQPGDVIETGATGRVVIALSDGSLITVAPNSRIVLKDFRQTNSLRELLDVVAGRVRAKIQHLGKRPNPYRINSPVASIAVRGTEFDVSVSLSGETRVTVYEGLVEVSSRIDPQQHRLVEPGRNVIVRATGDIGLNLPGPGGEVRGQVALYSFNDPAVDAFGAFLDPLFVTDALYDRYAQNFAERSLSDAPLFFTAFGDAFFDSRQNPAYATALRTAAGRVDVLTSFNAPAQRAFNTASTDFYIARPADRMFSGEANYFAPLGARAVIGGGLSIGRVGLESRTQLEERRPEEIERDTLSGALSFTETNLRLLAARRFGITERLSLGVQFDYLYGRASSQTDQWAQLLDPASEQQTSGRLLIASQTRARGTGLTIGLTREFAGGGKLGMHYRVGTAALRRPYQLLEDNIVFDDATVNERRYAHSHEAGWLWRAALSQRWFYSVQSSLLFEQLDTEEERRQTWRSAREQARRASLGGGIGFALRPQTVFSLDVAGGQRHADRTHVFTRDGQVIQTIAVKDDGHFLGLQLGAQAKLPRRFLFSAAQLLLKDWGLTENCGGRCNFYFTNLRFGRGFGSHWLAQYLFSTDYGRRGPSHSIVLRYSFEREH